MIRYVVGAAFRLDRWLHVKLGRPYAIALSVGLVLDILHRIRDAPEHVKSMHGAIGAILAVFMELALLLHQIAELHERFEPAAEPDGPDSAENRVDKSTA